VEGPLQWGAAGETGIQARVSCSMGVPRVVIVGRPNVGKSSVFNWLARRRGAHGDPPPGVPRARVSHLVDVNTRFVELVDTGGMGAEDVDNLSEQVEEQIRLA